MVAARCFLPAFIAAWVTSIFLPSLVIAALGVPPIVAPTTNLLQLPGATWAVADAVGPVVKLTIGAVLLAAFLIMDSRMAVAVRTRFPVAMLIGMIAVTTAAALLPADLSRGFGVRLTGERFSPLLLPIYLAGGALAGIAFVATLRRCRKNRPE